jgi:non-specific serine/threonine protein kinase
MASAVLDGTVYVVGGLGADGIPLATVEVYDAAEDRWSAGPDLPVAVHHAMATVLDGTLHVAGGYGDGAVATRRVYRLGPDGWEPVARLPLARAAGTMVGLGGQLLLAGGLDLGGELAREMLVYEPIEDAWSVADGPPTPREHLGGAVMDGRFVTVGGRISGVQVGAVETWDLMTETWETLPDLPTPRAGLGVSATCDGGLVAIGGEDIRGVDDRTFVEVEAYDPEAAAWHRLPDLPEGRHGLAVAAVGPTVLAIGGGPDAGLSASDTVEALEVGDGPGCTGTVTPP